MERDPFGKKVKTAFDQRKLNTTHLWGRLEKKLDAKKAKRKQFQKIAIAASIIILIGTGSPWMTSFLSSDPTKPFPKQIAKQPLNRIDDTLTNTLPLAIENVQKTIPSVKRKAVPIWKNTIPKKGYVWMQAEIKTGNEKALNDFLQNIKAEQEVRRFLEEALAGMDFEVPPSDFISAEGLLEIAEIEIAEEESLKVRILNLLESGYQGLQYVFNKPKKQQKK